MSNADYDYVGNLFDGLDLSKPVKNDMNVSVVKTTETQVMKSDVSRKRTTVKKPKVDKVPPPWANRIPNADADYIIPDEAYDPEL